MKDYWMKVLVCGSRHWPWPETVMAALDLATIRHGELIVIEGAANGADRAAHAWCEARGWGEDRHRCFPVNWQAERRRRPVGWKVAGHERNTRMLAERPRLIVAFHHEFDGRRGGTSDMCLKGLLADVPVWLVSGPDPRVGSWLQLDGRFPAERVERARRELEGARIPAVCGR